jgi:hypothetical protein
MDSMWKEVVVAISAGRDFFMQGDVHYVHVKWQFCFMITSREAEKTAFIFKDGNCVSNPRLKL